MHADRYIITDRMNANPNSILEQFFSEYATYHEKVRFRNVESVNQVIQQIVQDGPANLQVITDFDFTLSKNHTKDNKKCFPAADIIRQSPLMSDEFKLRSRRRFDQLLPVELDVSLTVEEKIPTVIASFKDGFDDIVNTKVLNKKSLAGMIANADEFFQLRDNCDKTIQCLHRTQIPCLIFSAGFGDLIQGLLQKYDLNYPNIHVIANFMEFNEKDGLVGFKEPLIHTFNKNESVIPENCQYFNNLSQRSNVILLGDSIGDAFMAQGVHKPGNVLKIGFLNHVDEQQLEIFLDSFDIVLLDDQTMDFVNFLLLKICSV